MTPRTRYAKTGKFNIAYQVVGEGPIDVVLSPGWITHLELAWDVPPLARFLERLSRSSRLILFDKRGTGLSDRVGLEELPTLEERMDDVRAVMDAVGSEHAVQFGTLGGGAMAGLYAATFPQRTMGLILYGTFAKLEPDTGLLARLADSQEAALERIEREWGTESVCVSFWAPSLATDDRAKEAFLRLARSSVSPGSAKILMRMGYRVDWEAFLPTISHPTLVMHRSGDLVIPVRQGRQLAEGIPGARFVELPGTDHLLWAGDQEPILAEVEGFLQGLDPRTRPVRQLATILFTDISGSTETLERLGDRRWRELLARHHEVVRGAIGRYRGVEVETAGDSFLVTFDGPARAIECARTIVRELDAIGITVRAGIHTGECEVTDEGIQGIAVHTAARVMDRADPGEVLVTGTVRNLVGGSGIAFEDRGLHTLKGVAEQQQLFSAPLARRAGSPGPIA